mgnify:CR=1 FL=1
MKPAMVLMISLLVLVSCESGKRDVKYLLTDEQLSSLMFDVQLSEVALAEVTEERQDSLRDLFWLCLLYTSPSPRDRTRSRMPSSA